VGDRGGGQGVREPRGRVLVAGGLFQGHRRGLFQGHRATAYQLLGDSSRAIEDHEQDLASAKEVGDRAGEGGAYRNLCNVYDCPGDFSKAIEYHGQHLVAIAKEVGDRAGEVSLLTCHTYVENDG
jgi:tetratricopeptide (TPR) repeat protein